MLATVAVRFFGVMRGIFRYGERYWAHNTVFRFLSSLRAWFYNRLEPLAPAVLLPYTSGGFLDRLLREVEVLENIYLRVWMPLWEALAVLLVLAVFLWFYSPFLSLSFIAGFPSWEESCPFCSITWKGPKGLGEGPEPFIRKPLPRWWSSSGR